MSVWDTLVGQRPAIEVLSRAATGHGMTHAWLFTGPPGSGRSNAAVAFAAALQCDRGTGCGECKSCHDAMIGSHPDVQRVRTAKLSIGVKETRELVRTSALSPSLGKWHVIIIEDFDRLTEDASNALLKAIEEPTKRTIWLMCAPTVEDVLPTIRSRSRLVSLTTPSVEAVAAFLERTTGAAPGLASFAARSSQGHIGRARALATDESTRKRRHEIVNWPASLDSLGAALNAAVNLADLAKEEAESITAALDKREKDDLDEAFGVEARGRRPREYAPALAALERDQKTRAKRQVLDVIDRGLMDLVSVYRDVLAIQLGGAGLVNEELRPDLERMARHGSPEDNLHRIDAIFAAREQMLEFNVPPLLALESMMVGLRLVPAGGHR